MTSRSWMLTAMTAALGLTLTVSPALAQGKGNGKAKQQDRARVEQQRSDWNDPLRVGYPDRQVAPRGNGAGKVPPGWCKGVGNPHNTPENCGYGRYDSRVSYPDDRRSPYPNDRGSYEQAHAEFHRDLDYRYERLASQRPLDLAYQVELQARKRSEHNEWHRRMGISH